MTLTILGSGAAVPSPRRGMSGYLLRAGGDTLVIDTGPGTIPRLMKEGSDPRQVTHLIYSHNHLDHTGDLAAWLASCRVPGEERSLPLTILGSEGFHEMFTALRRAYGSMIDPSGYDLGTAALSAARRDRHDAGGWSVQAFPVDHIASSIGLRVTDSAGRVFVYTGDTAPCDTLVDLARDADLLLIESSTPDGSRLPRHLTPSDVAAVAARANVRRVVLTHLYPVCDGVDMLDPVRRHFDGEAILAEDGMTVEI